METCIINDVLHVTLSQPENHAVHCAAWVAPACQADRDLATLGRAILQEIDKLHRERFARTGKATPVLVKVETPPARIDGLEAQRERWAQESARTTPFPLETCRLVANFADDERQAESILEISRATGKPPAAVIEALKEVLEKL